MPKLTLSDVSNLGGNPASAQQVINANSDRIEAAVEKTLSRDGTTPNHMESDFDMNHYDIINAGTVSADKFFLDGVEFEGTALWIIASGAPGASLGKISDVYMDSLTGDVYGPKSAEGWGPIAANIKGPQGIQGPQGVQGIQGIQGIQGMQGPQGIQGPTGIQGPEGPQGDSFSPDAIGLTSDRATYDAEPKGFSFLDTQTGYLYFKLSNTSGNWSSGITFTTGPQGPVGPQGPQGPEGPQGVEGPQGPKGDPGTNGTNGANGADGQGVPTGGTTGQILAKTSNVNFATQWVDPVSQDSRIIDTTVLLTTTNIPSSVNSIQTRGYNNTSDGGGGLWVRSTTHIRGDNMTIDGGFNSTSYWTVSGGWTISGGVASNSGSPAGGNLRQDALVLMSGVIYEITFTVSGYVQGNVLPSLQGGTVVNGTAVTANGTYTQQLTAVSGNTSLNFGASASTPGIMTIDNVSMRPVLTGLSRASSDGANWVLRSPEIRPEMLGAVGDGATDDSNSLNWAARSGRPVRLLAKTYYSSLAVWFPDGGVLTGVGRGASRMLFAPGVGGVIISLTKNWKPFHVQGLEVATSGNSTTTIGLSVDGSRQITSTQAGTGFGVVGERHRNRGKVIDFGSVGSSISNCWGVAISFRGVTNFSMDTIVTTGDGSVSNRAYTGTGIRIGGDGIPVDIRLHNIWGYYHKYAIQTTDYVEGIHLTNFEIVHAEYGVFGGVSTQDLTTASCLGFFASNGHVNATRTGIHVIGEQGRINNMLMYFEDNLVSTEKRGILAGVGNDWMINGITVYSLGTTSGGTSGVFLQGVSRSCVSNVSTRCTVASAGLAAVTMTDAATYNAVDVLTGSNCQYNVFYADTTANNTVGSTYTNFATNRTNNAGTNNIAVTRP